MRFVNKTITALALAGGLFALGLGTASAEPLVKMEGDKPAPGVVTSWSSSGNKVELTLKDGTDAAAVAAAIEGGVDKVKAKAQGNKVVVIGKAEADLLKALASVELGGDDLGALAAAGGGGDEADSGSSLRAKKTVDLAKLMKDQATSAQGSVVEAGGTTFPNAEITLNVTRAPTGELGKDIRKGKKIKLKPIFKMKGAAIDWSDENTVTNAGAWYFQKGDKIFVKLGKGANGAYEAEIITRQ
ncbi:hypothetical protein L6R52_02040 [Myxococcota bacterium]|nr:hypothetical protein [Myxococcota bacterium]